MTETEKLVRNLDNRIHVLEKAMQDVTSSYECYCHIHEPKPEDQMDEYDLMMRPKWERIVELLMENDERD